MRNVPASSGEGTDRGNRVVNRECESWNVDLQMLVKIASHFCMALESRPM